MKIYDIAGQLKQLIDECTNRSGEEQAVTEQAKLKHLDHIQAAIERMSRNSFVYKGAAITLASGLAAFAARDTQRELLTIALISTLLFWGLDGYYLWLERGFIKLHESVAAKPESEIDFSMRIDKCWAWLKWPRTCLRLHLVVLYGSVLVVEIVGIVLTKGGEHG